MNKQIHRFNIGEKCWINVQDGENRNLEMIIPNDTYAVYAGIRFDSVNKSVMHDFVYLSLNQGSRLRTLSVSEYEFKNGRMTYSPKKGYFNLSNGADLRERKIAEEAGI